MSDIEPKPLYAEDLPRGCAKCGTQGPVYLHARCHPAAGTWVSVDGDVAMVVCRECRKHVVGLRLARKGNSS